MGDTRWNPEWAVAPGEVLVEALEERGMSQAELARRMARPLKTINEIAAGKAAITSATAIQLERTLGISAAAWLGLESGYREAQARAHDTAALEGHTAWLRRFPLAELGRRGVLDRKATDAQQAAQLLSFFGVSSPAGWNQHWGKIAAQYLMSERQAVSDEAVTVWLRFAELQVHDQLPTFEEGRLRAGVPALRALSRSLVIAGAIARAIEVLGEAGVGLLMIEGVGGAPASGAVRWIRGHPWIVLTARYSADDQFWFSLFHEIGHVLEPRRQRDVVEEVSDRERREPSEEAANAFAREALVPQAALEAWLDGLIVDRASIRKFAAEIGVSPGVVVGRIQRDQFVAWSRFNDLKRRLRPANRR